MDRIVTHTVGRNDGLRPTEMGIIGNGHYISLMHNNKPVHRLAVEYTLIAK